MPRPGPVRPLVGVKMDAVRIEEYDAQAQQEGLLMKSGKPNRSELIRIKLAFADEHMPNGWRPA
ncbi:hypothetical protein ABIC28_004492 [Rhodococcus sp. PvR044]|jgi:hypothetical protein|uniref:hypothetical protein n=1 Tax=Rhodococcus TaxID=1827 RepID=UPI000BD2CCB0|nr:MULTISPECIES: hypothetical protein [Rhodococcus]MBP1159105.1 hypothetical protein [Rhodococcus sp. PvR099]MCZ4558568.1 hypothetical protein [Rhodococcus maanshanensis]PTR39010.1 hypothetical protein C8K38_11658 [Rhodococcus sp. OK611]SNX92796.1 hypothetical protein SAMN05447004_11658 [Rhodococcus sp. OK270]